jgi:hypothetical protein
VHVFVFKNNGARAPIFKRMIFLTNIYDTLVAKGSRFFADVKAPAYPYTDWRSLQRF